MSSSALPTRRIASNLLWTPQGVVRDPLLTLGADGRVVCAERCAEPDRMAGTEFYAGMLVPGFPADWRAAFERLRTCAAKRPETSLTELLACMCGDSCPNPDLFVEPDDPAGTASEQRVGPCGDSAGVSARTHRSGDASRSALCEPSDLPLPGAGGGVLVVISGLDYSAMRLTPHSEIRKL